MQTIHVMNAVYLMHNTLTFHMLGITGRCHRVFQASISNKLSKSFCLLMRTQPHTIASQAGMAAAQEEFGTYPDLAEGPPAWHKPGDARYVVALCHH